MKTTQTTSSISSNDDAYANDENCYDAVADDEYDVDNDVDDDVDDDV